MEELYTNVVTHVVLSVNYQGIFRIQKFPVHGAQCEPPLLEWLPMLKKHEQEQTATQTKEI